MGRIKIDWEEVAEDYGYKSPEEMIDDLYIKKEMTQNEIAELLNLSPSTIKKFIHSLDIPIRTKTFRPADRNPKLPGE
jgi:hypothetical protein